MKLLYLNGIVSVILRVKILDNASTTGSGLKGLTNSSTGLIISTIADTESAATVYTSSGSTIDTITTLGTFATPTATHCRFKEVDSTNHPGLYEIQLANARYGVSNARSLVVTVQVTGGVQVDAELQLSAADLNNATTLGLSALPNAAAGASGGLPTGDGSGRVQVQSGTGTGQINLSSGNVGVQSGTGANQINLSSGNVGVQSGTGANQLNLSAGNIGVQSGTGSNQINLSSGNVALQGVDSLTLQTGTAQAGAASTITLSSGAVATDHFYEGAQVRISSGTGSGQAPRVITGYVGFTKVATVDRSWATNPDNTSVYEVFSASSVAVNSSFQVTAASVQGNVTGSVNSVTSAVPVQSGTGANQINLSSGNVGVQSGTGANQVNLSSGNVTVAGYAASQDPGTYILVTPANKISTNASNQVVASSVQGNVTGSVNSVTSAVPVQSGTGANQINLSSGNVALQAVDSLTIQAGTAQAGAASTITLASGASATDHYYEGAQVRISSGTGSNQASRVITGYVGATKVATVDRAWTTQPDNTSVYEVFASQAAAENSSLQVVSSSVQGNVTGSVNSVTSAVSVQSGTGANQINLSSGNVTVAGYASGEDPATLVLDVAASGHNTAGTIGAKINSAGSAGDPWATLTSSETTAGSYGVLLKQFVFDSNGNVKADVEDWLTHPVTVDTNNLPNVNVKDWNANVVGSGVPNTASVTVSGYSAGQDPGTYVLATPANKVNTDSSGNVALQAVDSLTLQTGTAQAGGASTITLASGASATDHFYEGAQVRISSGTGAGQSSRVITGYVGSTKVATVDRAWTTQPTNASVYEVFAAQAPAENSSLQVVSSSVVGSVASVTNPVLVSSGTGANQVNLSSGNVTVGAYASGEDPTTLILDVAASGHNTAGTVGAKINSAGSVTDPWTTLTSSETVAGSYGVLLKQFTFDSNGNVKSDVEDWNTHPVTVDTNNVPNTNVKDWNGVVVATAVPAASTATVSANVTQIASQTANAAGTVNFPGSIGTSTYNGTDTSGTTTLLSRIGQSVLFDGAGNVKSNVQTYPGNTPQTGDSYLRLGAPTGVSVSADIAAINSKTVNLPASFPSNFSAMLINSTGEITTSFAIRKNTLLNNFVFVMVSATDHLTPAMGLTVTATRSLDSAAFASCANSVTEIGSGYYAINLANTDTNANVIALKFTATGADTTNLVIITQS